MNPFVEGLLTLVVLAVLLGLPYLLSKRGLKGVQQHNTKEIAEQVKYSCPRHGEFTMLTAVLFNENRCPTCYRERLLEERGRTNTPQ
jgi:hypothetical protein